MVAGKVTGFLKAEMNPYLKPFKEVDVCRGCVGGCGGAAPINTPKTLILQISRLKFILAKICLNEN